MTTARVTVVGIQRMKRKMTNRVNFLGDDLRPVLQESAEELKADFENTIKTFTPGPVPDLAESTKKQKMKRVGFIYPILERTRQMIQSMYSRVSVKRRGGWVIAVGFAGSQKGTPNAVIAEAHITGGGRLPRRDFTKVSSDWKAHFFERLRAALRRIS